MMRIPTFRQFQHEADMISMQFDKMSQLQQQAASGKKLINASDDPVLASQIQTTQDYMNQLQEYSHNGTLAQNRSALFERTMLSVTGVTSDIQNLIVKSRTATLNDSDRAGIAKQMQGDLNSLLALANTQDSNGQYIFAGYNADTPPFIQQNGTYQYQGGFDSTNINIGPNAAALFNESGFDIFGDLPTGNGTFTVTASSSNTGTASTTSGSVTNQSAYVSDTYTVSIAQNSSGKLVYEVTGAASGQVIPAPPATLPDGAPLYTPGSNGQDINFNGMTINISPGANANDSFTVQPSTNQNIFNTVQGIVNALQTPVTNAGSFNQAMSQASASITQAFTSFTSYQSNVGTRTNEINAQIQNNRTLTLNQQKVMKDLGDADAAQVFSQLMQQSLALQATQEGYLKMQETLTQLLKL